MYQNPSVLFPEVIESLQFIFEEMADKYPNF